MFASDLIIFYCLADLLIAVTIINSMLILGGGILFQKGKYENKGLSPTYYFSLFALRSVLETRTLVMMFLSGNRSLVSYWIIHIINKIFCWFFYQNYGIFCISIKYETRIMAPLFKVLTLHLTQPWEIKQSDLWGSLATQVSFLREFQIHRKLCLHPPSKNPNPNQVRKHKWCLRINSQGCSGLLIQGHSCICACTPPLKNTGPTFW